MAAKSEKPMLAPAVAVGTVEGMELPTEVFDCDSCGSKVFGVKMPDGTIKPESVDAPSLLRAHSANELAREEYQRQAEGYKALYEDAKAALDAVVAQLAELTTALSPHEEKAQSDASPASPH